MERHPQQITQTQPGQGALRCSWFSLTCLWGCAGGRGLLLGGLYPEAWGTEGGQSRVLGEETELQRERLEYPVWGWYTEGEKTQGYRPARMGTEFL